MNHHRILSQLIAVATLSLATPAFAQFSPGGATITTTVAAQTLSANTGTINIGGAIIITSGSTVPLAMTGTSILINNGTIQTLGSGRAIDSNSGTANLTITNSGLISSVSGDAFRVNTAGTSVSLSNSGTIQVTAGGQAIDWAAITTGSNSLTNQATGSITTVGEDAVRPGTNGIVINAGTISATPTGTTAPTGSDGIDLRTFTGIQVTNTGTISGRHGIATDGANVGPSTLTVTNNAGTILAINGSGINVDGPNATVTANVTNAFGATIKGGVLATATAGDGDGIDVDGVLTLNNSGNIFGYGAKGSGSDGGQNNAEAVSIGGGSITNTATGQIIGSTLLADAANGDSSRAGNGIRVDNSSGGNAVAATTVTNSGLIQGKTGNAIKMVGTFANTATNNAGGTIRGAGTGAAIQTGDGGDTITNKGAIIGDNGSAIAMEAGNDILNIQGGAASITGSIDGGTGTNTMNITLGAGNTFNYGGAITNFNTSVQSGTFNYTGSGIGGNVTVDGGTFKSNGGTVTGTVTVNSGTVSGTNLSGVALSIGAGATLSPGNSPGTLSTGSETWAGGGSYLWEINALGVAGGTQGNNPGWDFADITGSLTITANSGNKFNINLDSLALLTSWDNSQSYSFNLATASGGISGFDASDFLINTSAFDDQHSLGVGHFYVEQDGNSLELNFTPVPEPATIGIGIALMGVAFIRRRRGA